MFPPEIYAGPTILGPPPVDGTVTGPSCKKRAIETLLLNCISQPFFLSFSSSSSSFFAKSHHPSEETNDRRSGDIYIPSKAANDVNLGKHLHALALLN